MGDETSGEASGAPRELLTVLIPAYNEEATIGPTVRDVVAALDRCAVPHEVLVVNDSSTDQTTARLAELQSRYPQLRYVDNAGPRGYGRAVRCGLSHYRGSAVVVVMADGADAPQDIVRYFETLLRGYDCVFGSRFIPGAALEGYPRFKRILNRMGNRLIALLLRHPYNDFTNGFKCYRREVIELIRPLESDEFNLTIEMSIKAILRGARVAIVPNGWTNRSAGQSKFRLLSQAGRYLRTMLSCLIAHRRAQSRHAGRPPR
jgi:dolichol-phosphate mannosyltransferase